MAYSTTHLYPEDLYGTNPQNLITNELHTLQVPGPTDFYFIIPFAAPFFVDSLKVINAATGLPYVEGDDYQVGHLFIEAMDSTGRPIAGSIRFMKNTIQGQVKLTYRTLGGPWGFSDAAILRELSNKQVNPLIRSWGDIDVLPYSFPPLPHDQRIDTLVGSKEINTSLERIAEILEATAEGTSQSHITNYDNPHRVTAEQVGLGNVPNFSMATDAQMSDATRSDLFTNPRGVLVLVNKYAVEPLNVHVAATGNVHHMVPTDIGLGNVPNWAPATPEQAIDPTNVNTFMSPYTTALLIQKLQNDPRLDQLIIDFNDHITATNPHHITPAMIGTYSSTEIDQMIAQISQGGNATTFGGETPEEWEDKFPMKSDINGILDELATLVNESTATLTALDLSDPVTDNDIALRNAQRLGSAWGAYGAYGLYNTFDDLKIVADTELRVGFPTEVVKEGRAIWATAENAGYYIMPDGSIDSWGTGKVTIPFGYAKGTGYQQANASKYIFSAKDTVYLYLKNNKLLMINRGSGAVEVGTYASVDSIYINNGMQDNRSFGIIRIATNPEGTTHDWQPFGDASWVTAANAIKQRAATDGYTVMDIRIGTDHLIVLTSKGDDTFVWIYEIAFGASITLNDVTSTTSIMNHSTDAFAPASSVNGITQIAGSYTHFVFTKPIPAPPPEGSADPIQELCDLYSFGSNSNGQLEITSASGPFLAAGAGYGFTVTINSMHFAEFWGDSPDNSLIYDGGSILTPPTT